MTLTDAIALPTADLAATPSAMAAIRSALATRAVTRTELLCALRDAGHQWTIADERIVTPLTREIRDAERATKRAARDAEQAARSGTDPLESLHSRAIRPTDDVDPPPPQYIWTDDGTWRVSERRDGTPVAVRVAHGPVRVAAIELDAETGEESWVVVWGTGWGSRALIPRRHASDSRSIVAYASQSLPITSTCAGECVTYLSEYVTHARPDVSTVARRLGWIGDRWSGGPATSPDLRVEAAVHMVAHGTLDAQIAAMRIALDVASGDGLLAVGTALASVALRPLDRPSWVASIDGRTSSGKSTLLALCASIYGDPRERSSTAILTTWDSTTTHLQRMAVALSDVPLCVDDRSRAVDPRVVVRAVYDTTQGRGRGRGTTEARGIERVETWRSTVISTGESPLTSLGAMGGTRARIIQCGAPWTPETTGDTVSSIYAAVTEHYGHAGAVWIRALMDPATLDRIRTEEAHIRRDHPLDTSDAVAHRVEKHIVCALACLSVASSVLGLDPPINRAYASARIALAYAALSADVPEVAWGLLQGWLASVYGRIDHGEDAEESDNPYGPRSKGRQAAVLSYVGARIAVGGVTRLHVVPSILREWLEGSKFDVDSTISAWTDAGRIERVRVRWGGGHPTMYRFTEQ